MCKRNRLRPRTEPWGFSRVYRGRLRSGTVDNNRLLPVSKETLNPGVDLSSDAIAVELVHKETVADFIKYLGEGHDNQIFLTSFFPVLLMPRSPVPVAVTYSISLS